MLLPSDLARLRRADVKLRDRLLHGIDTRTSVGQLILLVHDRIPVARDLMSQHLGLVLRPAKTLDAIRLAVVFTLLRLE